MRHFLRSHVRSVAISACVIAIAAVGLTIGLVTSGGSHVAAAVPTVTAPPTTVAGAGTGTAKKHHQPRLRATITAIAPTDWTVTTAKGQAVTVDVTSTTRYGTPKAPATASSFATGQTVVILGARHGATLTATRIAVAPAKAPASGSPAATTAG